MVYGLTGGTGSGKTSVSEYLKEHGYKVVDADQIARELTEKGSPVLDELKTAFGPEIIAEDGSLLRKKLGSIVFNDKTKLDKLNEIMEERLNERFIKALDRAQVEDPYGKVFFDAPTLLETNREWLVDRIWVVVSDQEARIKRIMDRDGITREQVLSRMANQLSDEEKIKRADVVIYNNGSLDDLKLTVSNALDQSS